MSEKTWKRVWSGTVAFCSILTVFFSSLKLTDKIDWSWGWVLAPTWMLLSVTLGFYLFCVVILTWRTRQ